VTSQFLAPVVQVDDEEYDGSLRPRRLDEFVGQQRLKEQLDGYGDYAMRVRYRLIPGIW